MMNEQIDRIKNAPSSAVALCVIAAAACVFLTAAAIEGRNNIEKMKLKNSADALSARLMEAAITLDSSHLAGYFVLSVSVDDGYSYELSRFNAPAGKELVASAGRQVKARLYAEEAFQAGGGLWFVKVSSPYLWYAHPYNIALIIAGLSAAVIVFFVTRSNYGLKKNEAKNYQRAITDSLTGIFNRRHFMEMVPMSIEKSRRQKEDCYIIMFDIDHFKNINDTYGHQIGDKVLIDITARIKESIRLYDFFARYGGEEFIIFASKLSSEEIHKVGERLRTSICGKSFTYNNLSLECSASFGAAKMESYNLEEAIQQSDEALYAAKRNGRNRVVVYGEETPSN